MSLEKTGDIPYIPDYIANGIPQPEKWQGMEIAKKVGLNGYTVETMIEDSKLLIGFEAWLGRPPDMMLGRVIDEYTLTEFTYGHGDANPLFTDPDYAKNTRYGCLIAPPSFISELRYPVHRGALDWGPYPLTGFPSGVNWTWYDVNKVDDRFRSSMKLDDVFEKRGRTGRLIFTNVDVSVWNSRNRLAATCEAWFISVGRPEGWVEGEGYTGKGGMLYERPTYHYSEEEVKNLIAGIEGEERRGATPRYWEDVNVGDPLPPVVIGPYTFMSFITEQISGHSPRGNFELGGHKNKGLEWRKNPVTGWPYESRVMEHWDFNLCRGRGLPGPFDLGISRTEKNSHLLCNWMGDDGFLRNLNSSIRKPHYYGDTLTLSGEIVEKRKDTVGGVEYAAVDIIIHGMNQVGENCLPGKATVYLPSRELGEVVLPVPIPSEEEWTLITKRDVKDFIQEFSSGESIAPYLPTAMVNYQEWLAAQRKK